MSAINRLVEDLDGLQAGETWISYNAQDILEGIDHNTAATTAVKGGNSIWSLVNHISFWREMVARRVTARQGIVADVNGFEEPAEKTPEAWRQTRLRFEEACRQLRTAMASLDDNDLDVELNEKGTVYYNLQGSLLHDAYHLGQVMLLKRMAGIK